MTKASIVKKVIGEPLKKKDFCMQAMINRI